MTELGRVEFTRLRGFLAQFGASEQEVTEDLAPLAVVLNDPADQRFVATQLYDEARHAEFLEQYWETVIHQVEDERGVARTDPTADRWHAEPHKTLLRRTSDAMARLLTTADPEMRARAYSHYHLVVEGVLAQTAYEWVDERYSEESSDGLALPALTSGFQRLQQDEARHVTFGVRRVQDLLDAGVDTAVVVETIDELLPFVEATIDRMVTESGREQLLEQVEEERDQRLKEVGAVEAA
ncbi:ferritin family protein [Halorubrum pallidum]|uniref:Ribonucleoside-diphosphate reductase n=1 Tax=Halorubrum pallidum TaxID=1526114 RepID=A0ABD5T4D8_9EURY